MALDISFFPNNLTFLVIFLIKESVRLMTVVKQLPVTLILRGNENLGELNELLKARKGHTSGKVLKKTITRTHRALNSIVFET